MANELVRDLLDAGVHFGHRCSRWNPKMKPFIYGRRNDIHIIDIRETLRGMLRARKLIARVVGNGQDVLFVGTKRQARDIIAEQAQRCKMHYVCERWLGGTLTNFRTIRSRLARLEELEAIVGGPEWETGYSKKMKAMLTRELKKIRTNLQGIRNMSRLPGALVLVDVRKEINAVREAETLSIPTIALVDTDGDPDRVSVVIPANDDAMRGIETIMKYLADGVEEALRARPEPRPQEEAQESADFGAAPPRRRGRRPPGERSARPERGGRERVPASHAARDDRGSATEAEPALESGSPPAAAAAGGSDPATTNPGPT